MKPKILTVDDSKTIRLIVGKAFKPFDCDIFEASNGVEGLAVASREKPDLIILDLTMPIMDGAEMLAKLKSSPELKNIPVIMLTAEAGRENVLRIARMGVRDYLIKPFKEEQLIERSSRVIDLKPKGGTAARAKRFDDPISLLIVDDKPAILDQIRGGLSDIPWNIQGRSQTGEAIDFCSQNNPDVILVSLSLPDNGGFTLFQMLRASTKTKSVPVFGLCVKTASDEQVRAQQAGFTGLITKPIDFDDLKGKLGRALNLDTSYRYFEQKDGVLVLKFPGTFTPNAANEITLHLRNKVSEAVDAGIDKLVLDMSALKTADVNLIRLGLSAMQLCHELSLKQRIVGSEAVCNECGNYEETKDWAFVATYQDALNALNNVSLAAA
ncbi:MAG TPA: response regulator [Verrucomicrobiae bacterium]